MDWAKHQKVRNCAQQLALGEVVAYPTESVWGLGCDPNNLSAVQKLLQIKARPIDKGVLLIAASISQFEPFLSDLSSTQRKLLTEDQELPITWLIPDSNKVAPPWIRGRFQSVALRITQHPVAAALCRAFGGPIVSTSANPSSMLPAKTALKVRRYFGQNLMIAPGRVGTATRPSEIRDIVSGQVIRAG